MSETEQQEIFEDWLGQYRSVIFKVVKAYAFIKADQDDLFQEIIIQVWHSVPNFRQQSSVATWLYRISLNTAIKWVRKERRHSPPEPLDQFEQLLQESRQPMDERLTWLYEAIHKLDEIDRSVTLLMLDDFSYKEMADILGISESNVGVKINRIKKQLITKFKN